MKPPIFYLLVLAFFALPLAGNGQVIRGTVYDQEMGFVLPGAAIIITDGDVQIKGTTTDAAGQFVIDPGAPGRHSLRISYVGYQPELLHQILVTSGKDLILDIHLRRMVTQVDEVEIKANLRNDRPVNQMAMVSARAFSAEQTEKYAGSLGDPARMAQNFAGVMAAGDQRNDLVIRGNSPSGLLWRLEGIPIPNPNHWGASGATGGPVSMLNNHLLTRSDFYTGAFPAEFGNALSGVFDLRMRSGNKEKRESVFQIGFNGFELGNEGPISRQSGSSYLINYRYSTLAVMDLIGFPVASGAVPKYQDLSFKIDLPFSGNNRLQFFGLGGMSDILFSKESENDGSFNNAASVNTRNGSRMATLGGVYTHFFSPRTRLVSHLVMSGHQVYTQVDSVNRESDETIIFYGEQNQELNTQLQASLKHEFSSKTYGELGFRGLLMDVTFADSTRTSNDQYLRMTEATGENQVLSESFFQIRHHFTDQLSLAGGMHFQYFDLTHDFSAEPRIHLRWEAAPRHQFGLGYGLHSQTQPLLLYYTEFSGENGTSARTNSQLGFTKSHQLAANYKWMMAERLSLTVEGYYQYLYDVPVENHPSTFSTINSGASFHFDRRDSLVNEGTGINKGIELTFERRLEKGYYFLLTGSFFETTYKTLDGIKRSTQFNNNIVANGLAGYEFRIGKNQLYMDVRVTYAGGRRLMSIDLEASRFYQWTVFDESQAYELRSDPYFRTDLRIGFRKNGKKVSQEWAIDLQNLSNHQNVYSQYYDANQDEIRFNYQQGFMPMLLYRVYF